MKRYLYLTAFLLLISSCTNTNSPQPEQNNSWQKREVKNRTIINLQKHTSYLPVYSQIYQRHQNKTYDLTVTVSIRNTSSKDSLYLLSAEYYSTKGKLLKNYLMHPVYITPLETVEIIIEETDKSGGSGANFVLSWGERDSSLHPLFESVMISTAGQQGVSFTSRAIILD